MEIFLQIWGGTCYLANKVCFAFSEGKHTKVGNRTRILGWLAYIFGVPAWVIVLVGNQNWIAASIEAGGLPAMFLDTVVFFQSNHAHVLLPSQRPPSAFGKTGGLVVNGDKVIRTLK